MAVLIFLKAYLKLVAVTFVGDQEDGIFIQRLQPLQPHFKTELLNHIQSNLMLKIKWVGFFCTATNVAF